MSSFIQNRELNRISASPHVAGRHEQEKFTTKNILDEQNLDSRSNWCFSRIILYISDLFLRKYGETITFLIEVIIPSVYHKDQGLLTILEDNLKA